MKTDLVTPVVKEGFEMLWERRTPDHLKARIEEYVTSITEGSNKDLLTYIPERKEIQIDNAHNTRGSFLIGIWLEKRLMSFLTSKEQQEWVSWFYKNDDEDSDEEE